VARRSNDEIKVPEGVGPKPYIAVGCEVRPAGGWPESAPPAIPSLC